MDKQYIALAVLAIVVLGFGTYLYFRDNSQVSPNQNQTNNTLPINGTNTTMTPEMRAFVASVQAAGDVSILMNLTNITEAMDRQVVFSCAIDLSSSLSRLGKNVSNYAIDVDGASCISTDMSNTSIENCMEQLKTPVFYISYGKSNTTFYADRAYVFIDSSFKGQCGMTGA
jgi:hypothetical protein